MTTPLYSYNRNFPEPLPYRIRLSNGLTRTDSATFTNEELADAGYVLVDLPPQYNVVTQKIEWTGTSWKIVDLSLEAVNSAEYENIRQKRNALINEVIWRIQRYESELRLQITPTDNIESLDRYIQDLRDITKQPDPFNIVWPTLT